MEWNLVWEHCSGRKPTWPTKTSLFLTVICAMCQRITTCPQQQPMHPMSHVPYIHFRKKLQHDQWAIAAYKPWCSDNKIQNKMLVDTPTCPLWNSATFTNCSSFTPMGLACHGIPMNTDHGRTSQNPSLKSGRYLEKHRHGRDYGRHASKAIHCMFQARLAD